MTISEKTNNILNNNELTAKICDIVGSCLLLGYMKKYASFIGGLPGIFILLITKDLNITVQSVLVIIFAALAIFVSSKMEDAANVKNPKQIVIDDALGLWISLFALWDMTFPMIITAYIIYMALIYFKPFPLSVFQSFKSGFGIVADATAAGMVTNLLIRFLLFKGLF